MFLRKFLGFILTTLLTVFFLNLFFAIMDGFDNYHLLASLGLLLVSTAPFVLLIGLPVSFLSDYLTKNSTGKQRSKKALFVHGFFGLIAGSVISFLFESFFLVGVTVIAALIFWLADEFLREKVKGCKIKIA